MQTLLLLVAAWGLMLVMHGAIPFVLTPTLWQAVWTTGFAQSFVNQSLGAIHAINFGAPEPAAMAFGLPGAWTTGLFMRLSMAPPDAYSAMVASWMTLALLSACAWARHHAVSPNLAVLAALVWMGMPVTWGHAGYSMLSIGIALLPLYFLCTVKLLTQCALPAPRQWVWLLAHPLMCSLAIFMDGYSFVFFAVGASLLTGWWWLQAAPEGRRRLTRIALPLHLLGLLSAYLLYGAFVGKAVYPAATLDFFRGWGADVAFFLTPTEGVHALPDALGWGEKRSEQQYFGDMSVWTTTFAIPVMLAGIWAASRRVRIQGITTALVAITLFGFYMALGPSIKWNSVKPAGANPGQVMSAQAAWAPTGSGWLSDKVPGFNNMRASYRWTALGVFGAWTLLLLTLSAQAPRSTRRTAAWLMGTVMLLNLPPLQQKWATDQHHRRMLLQIETDLVDELRKVLDEGERVAFLPWNNDFLVNYLAARLNIVSYNIGGDKNLESARVHWPYWMGRFPMMQVDDDFADRVAMLLTSREADAVVLSYVDLLKAAHQWPAAHTYQNQVQEVARSLTASGLFAVTKHRHYMVVRPLPALMSQPQALLDRVCLPPVCLKRAGFPPGTPTQTGLLQGQSLVTQGQRGFLMFGPYVDMKPGTYRLIIQGSSQQHASAWVDVTAQKGKTSYGKFPLAPQAGNRLLQTSVVFPTHADDLEIRLFVGAEDQVQLDGYELRPAP